MFLLASLVNLENKKKKPAKTKNTIPPFHWPIIKRNKEIKKNY